MGATGDEDLDGVPDAVASATAMLVENALHLAGLPKDRPYPGYT